MNKKVRLYRGPFDGKVLHLDSAGQNTIVVSGLKPMTRKQRYEWERDQFANYNPMNPASAISPRYPQVTEYYDLVMLAPGIPCQHPDGSMFYEWSRPRRKRP